MAEIAALIIAQIKMGNPHGLKVTSFGVIEPSFAEGSERWKLLVLHSAKALLENHGADGQMTRDKIRSIEAEIYNLENAGQGS